MKAKSTPWPDVTLPELPAGDAFTVTVTEDDAVVAASDEDNVILDYDAAGNLVSLEILDAARRVTETRRMELS
jgi:YD repeat-containing protein